MNVEEFLQLVAAYGLTAQERSKNFWAVSSDGYHCVPIGNPVTLNMTPDEWQSMLSAIASRATRKGE
jgi:hypothetical protein